MSGTTKDNETASPARTCGVQFRAAKGGARYNSRLGTIAPATWRAGGLDELRLPPSGRKRIADLATLLGPGDSLLDYGGHEVPGLSKNPCFSPAHRLMWRCCDTASVSGVDSSRLRFLLA